MTLPAVALALLLPVLPLDLTGAAQGSVRPRECAPEGSRSSTIWDKAREPALVRYCECLARGFGQLTTLPQAAREEADRASKLAPFRAAPFVLAGRADVALGKYEEARLALEKARSIDDRALEEPGAMHAHAVALARTGKKKEARAIYRALASRVSLLAGADRRARVLLEGATLALSEGPEALGEAIAFLRQARREPVREVQARVLSMLALALDREGASEEASALLQEAIHRGGAKAVLAFASDDLGTGEAEAVLAWITEPTDPKAAGRLWENYLAGPAQAGPFASHARKRLEGLGFAAKTTMR